MENKLWLTSYNNCNSHNTKATSICLNPDCRIRMACNQCVMTEHKGHVDKYIVPFNKFLENFWKEFQRFFSFISLIVFLLRPEIDRLNRINFMQDIIQHVQREFKYLKEKVQTILSEKEKQLVQLLQKQYIHSTSFHDIIDHIEYMRDGKVFEEGLKVVLPLMLKDGGVQERILFYEREKVRISLKIKEQINQIKTVLDGLFHIGNQNQLEQHKLTVSQLASDGVAAAERDIDIYEKDLFNSALLTHKTDFTTTIKNQYLNEKQFSKSSIFNNGKPVPILKHPNPDQSPDGYLEKEQSYMYADNYQKFVEQLYPKYENKVDFLQVYENYQPQHFESQLEAFGSGYIFTLFGSMEHQRSVTCSIRMRTGEVLTCSNQLTFWDYPTLKQTQIAAFNLGIQILQIQYLAQIFLIGIYQVIEIMPNLIIAVTQNQISTFEKKQSKWVAKGEFITPGVGQQQYKVIQIPHFRKFRKIVSSDEQAAYKMVCILVSTQLLIYHLNEIGISGRNEDFLKSKGLDSIFASNNPQVYQHKFDCSAVGFEYDGARMVTGDSGGRLYRWKIGNIYNQEEIIQAHNSQVQGVIPIHDGRVCSISYDGVLKLWDRKLSPSALSVIKHRSIISAVSQMMQKVDIFFTGDIKGSKLQSQYIMKNHSDLNVENKYSN